MKKFLAMMLALLMVLSLAACGGNKDAAGDQPAEITGTLSLLETVWNDFGEDEKFAVIGGGPEQENMVDDAPGAYDLTDRSLAEINLVLPESAQVDEAASLIHMMNANTFTAAAYHATGDTDALATELRGAIQDHQWMCGFPDKVAVIVVGEYVVSVFGAEDLVDQFVSVLNGMCGVQPAYDEAIL